MGWLFLPVNLTTTTTKTQVAGYICKGFFFIESFEVGKTTLNMGHNIWSQSVQRKWRVEAPALCLLAFTLADKPIPSLYYIILLCDANIY